MIIMSNETLKNASVSATSTSSNYLAPNVLDSRLTRIYKSQTGESNIYITFTNSQEITVNAIAIANHNILDGATIKWQGNNTNDFTSPIINETLDWNESIISKSFTGDSLKYWRLSIEGSTGDYISIGRIFGSDGYSVPISPMIGHTRQSHSLKSLSVSGQSYQDTRYFNSVISVRWNRLSFEQKKELIKQFEYSDIGNPFFIMFDETCTDLETTYVTIDGDSINFNLLANINYYEASMSFVEEV